MQVAATMHQDAKAANGRRRVNRRQGPTVQRTPAAGPPATPDVRITLLRAWREAAFRPSRHTFESLAAIADRRWVVASLLVSLALLARAWLVPRVEQGDAHGPQLVLVSR